MAKIEGIRDYVTEHISWHTYTLAPGSPILTRHSSAHIGAEEVSMVSFGSSLHVVNAQYDV